MTEEEKQLNIYSKNKDFNNITTLCVKNKLHNLYNILRNNYKIQDYQKTIYVKITCNWIPSEELLKFWNRMSYDNNGRWGVIQLVDEKHPKCDYSVVINAPFQPIKLEKEKTIIFRMEPNIEQNTEFWGPWADVSDKGMLVIGHNNLEWHLGKNYQYLNNDTPIKKFDYCMSTVVSNKYFDPGHIKRIDFLKIFDKQGDIPLHVFGTNNKWLWKNYKGSLPPCEKDNALFPYKYTFNCENNFIPNYFTEKIVDAILSECLIFYCGCPNVKEYIDERAFVQLDLDNPFEDMKRIEECIKNNLWEERIQYIRKEKYRILNEMQFFPRLEKIVKDLENI